MTHAEAAEIVRAAFRRVHGRAPSTRERLYTQAVAALETGYGRAGQFGRLAAQGRYNWGALETRRLPDGTCPAGTAAGTDQGAVCFYVFPDDVSAATEFVRVLTARRPHVLRAMQSGTPSDVARAMRQSPAYYEGVGATTEEKIAGYARAITARIGEIGEAVPTKVAAAALFPFVLAAGAGLAYWWWSTREQGRSRARRAA